VGKEDLRPVVEGGRKENKTNSITEHRASTIQGFRGGKGGRMSFIDGKKEENGVWR